MNRNIITGVLTVLLCLGGCVVKQEYPGACSSESRSELRGKSHPYPSTPCLEKLEREKTRVLFARHVGEVLSDTTRFGWDMEKEVADTKDQFRKEGVTYQELGVSEADFHCAIVRAYKRTLVCMEGMANGFENENKTFGPCRYDALEGQRSQGNPAQNTLYHYVDIDRYPALVAKYREFRDHLAVAVTKGRYLTDGDIREEIEKERHVSILNFYECPLDRYVAFFGIGIPSAETVRVCAEKVRYAVARKVVSWNELGTTEMNMLRSVERIAYVEYYANLVVESIAPEGDAPAYVSPMEVYVLAGILRTVVSRGDITWRRIGFNTEMEFCDFMKRLEIMRGDKR